MYYLLFYWIFSSLFAYNYLVDEKTNLFGHHFLMIIVGCIIGWLILPIALGKLTDKILNS